MTASDREWTPEPARLRDGEHRDDDNAHARRNRQQLELARTFHAVPEGEVRRGVEWRGAVESLAARGSMVYALTDNVSVYARYRAEDGPDALAFEVVRVAPGDRWVRQGDVDAVTVAQWLERAEAVMVVDETDAGDGGATIE